MVNCACSRRYMQQEVKELKNIDKLELTIADVIQMISAVVLFSVVANYAIKAFVCATLKVAAMTGRIAY